MFNALLGQINPGVPAKSPTLPTPWPYAGTGSPTPSPVGGGKTPSYSTQPSPGGGWDGPAEQANLTPTGPGAYNPLTNPGGYQTTPWQDTNFGQMGFGRAPGYVDPPSGGPNPNDTRFGAPWGGDGTWTGPDGQRFFDPGWSQEMDWAFNDTGTTGGQSNLQPGGRYSDDGNWYYPPMPVAQPGTMQAQVMPQPIWVGTGPGPDSPYGMLGMGPSGSTTGYAGGPRSPDGQAAPFSTSANVRRGGYRSPREMGYAAPTDQASAPWVTRGLDTLFNAMNAYGKSADFGGSQYGNPNDQVLWRDAGNFISNLDKFGMMPKGASYSPTMQGFSPYQGMSPNMLGTAADAYSDSRGRQNYYRDILEGFGYQFPEQAAAPAPAETPVTSQPPPASGLDVLLNALNQQQPPQQASSNNSVPAMMPPVTNQPGLPNSGRFWENWR